jgi:predicted HNH restriction endonuclease
MSFVNTDDFKIKLSNHTLKVQKLNALAYIYGYEKDREIKKSSILAANKENHCFDGNFKELPKLITLTKNNKFKKSSIGKELIQKNYPIENKFVAFLDTIFHIKNDPKIWEELCKDGTFDIWKPEAPRRLIENKEDPCILLLRIFEINKAISAEKVKLGLYTDQLKEEQEVTLKEELVKDKEFLKLKIHLIETLYKIENCVKFEIGNKIETISDQAIVKKRVEELRASYERKFHEERIPEEIPDEEANKLPEGAKKQITVNAYERNQKAREKCIKEYGYACSVCEFNFEEVYGEIGTGYIHVHHLKPLSEINEEYEVDPFEDLIPVCPNCHCMLHKTGLTIVQLRASLIKK